MKGYQLGRRMRGKVQRLRSIIGRYKIDRGDVKNSIGNRVTKEFICMPHGHELGGEIAGRNEGTGHRGAKREKLKQL